MDTRGKTYTYEIEEKDGGIYKGTIDVMTIRIFYKIMALVVLITLLVCMVKHLK
jgi:hypothetical protein